MFCQPASFSIVWGSSQHRMVKWTENLVSVSISLSLFALQISGVTAAEKKTTQSPGIPSPFSRKYEAALYGVRPLVYLAHYCQHWLIAALQGFR